MLRLLPTKRGQALVEMALMAPVLFLMVLGASRHMFVRPVWALDLKTWIRCHVEAMDFFGAVARRWVIDNLKDGFEAGKW